MNVKLQFDCSSKTIYIPDGYVDDLGKLQLSFLDWIKQQPECITNTHRNQIGYFYNEIHFLKYVNDVLLINSREKAYFTKQLQNNHVNNHVIKF